MQKDINITAQDGMKITGMLCEPKENSENLVIFVHGVFGSYNEHIIKSLMELFFEKRFSVYGYNQYSEEIKDGEQPRALHGSVDIERHIQDLEDVFNHFKSKYKNIYLVGHSLGGLTIAAANLPCKAQVLLDPSVGGPFKGEAYQEISDGRPIKQSRGLISVFNDKMAASKESYTPKIIKDLCKDIQTPTDIIGFSEGFAEKANIYTECPNSKFELTESDHACTALGKPREIGLKMLDFFKQSSMPTMKITGEPGFRPQYNS